MILIDFLKKEKVPLVKPNKWLLKFAGKNLNVRYFLQENVPENPPFWKIGGEEVVEIDGSYIILKKIVEMTSEEIALNEARVAYRTLKESKFKGLRYRVECEASGVKDTALWPDLIITALAFSSIPTDGSYPLKDGVPTKKFYVYLTQILPEDRAALEYYPDVFTIFDVEDFNPDAI